MISHSKQFIFVHISKTGGSSIEKVLSAYSAFPVSFQSNGNSQLEDKHFAITRYSSPDLIFKSLVKQRYFFRAFVHHYLGLRTDTSSYFKFAFVRNPWDRLVSNYHYFCSIDTSMPRSTLVYNTFDEWLLGTPSERKSPDGVGVWVDRFRTTDRAPIPQQIGAITLQGEIAVDFVGRYERLQLDFDGVCERIGVPRVDLPHFNRSQRADFSVYYTKKTRQLVRELYRADIEHFGYSFE